ncbi:MAG: tetratricopeptide repeat protein [Syntrophobacterales bacterium]|nr:tetratricopeptide repeat protein [Syntrophobacterales bacterium]
MTFKKLQNKKIMLLIAAVTMLTLLISALSLNARAGEHEDLFALGNQAYAAGKFNEAISHYKEIMKTGGVSASLLYNMANAYYHKKDAGQAILNYKRALSLDPGNADIQANLRMAQKDFGLIPEPVPVWQKFFNIMNMNRWTWIISAAFALFSISFLLRGIIPVWIPPTPFRAIVSTFLILFVISTAAVTLQYKKLDLGVVTHADTRLHVSPFDAASSPTGIKNGTVVKITKTYGDYVFIEEPEGKSGWVQRKAVEPIVTP